MGDRAELTRLAGQRDIREVLLDHAVRGLRIQVWVRAALAGFAILTVILEPPAHDRTACLVLAGCYAGWAAGIAVVTLRITEFAARFGWLALFGDLAALAGLTVLASSSVVESWTADIVVNGLVLIGCVLLSRVQTLA